MHVDVSQNNSARLDVPYPKTEVSFFDNFGTASQKWHSRFMKRYINILGNQQVQRWLDMYDFLQNPPSISELEYFLYNKWSHSKWPRGLSWWYRDILTTRGPSQ